MAYWQGYFGIENIGLTSEQKATLVDWFKTFGRSDLSPFPNLRMQTRLRLDNDAAIFEALFNDDWLSVDFVKNKLGDIFGVDPSTIISETSSSSYGPVVLFSRPSGTDRLRMILFGGIGSTWESSRLAAVSYLRDNRNDWEISE